MRICLITNGFPINKSDYVAAFAYYYSLSLIEMGHEVFVFTPNRVGIKSDYENINVRWYEWWGGSKPLVKYNFFNPFDLFKVVSLMWSGKKEILNYVQENNIDFCLALWATPSGKFASIVKKKLGIPYGVWCLGSDIWIYSNIPIIKGITKKILQKADVVYADGIQLLKDVEQLAKIKCDFLPTSRVLPKKNDSILLNPDKTNYTFVGRLEKVKGVDILIKAISEFITSTKDIKVHFYIFGVGTMEQYIIKLIKELELEKYISFKGYASAEDAATYLENCDWVIIPSINESIPVVMSDAVQKNTPLIVTDVGDMGDLVKEYNAGIVTKSNSVSDLSNALQKSYLEKDKYSIYKENTIKLAQKFDIPTAANKLVNDINIIINNKI
ncbi:MAG: glycosyltransferase [Candidatus Kerfeldbacteria bacterium]